MAYRQSTGTGPPRRGINNIQHNQVSDILVKAPSGARPWLPPGTQRALSGASGVGVRAVSAVDAVALVRRQAVVAVQKVAQAHARAVAKDDAAWPTYRTRRGPQVRHRTVGTTVTRRGPNSRLEQVRLQYRKFSYVNALAMWTLRLGFQLFRRQLCPTWYVLRRQAVHLPLKGPESGMMLPGGQVDDGASTSPDGPGDDACRGRWVSGQVCGERVRHTGRVEMGVLGWLAAARGQTDVVLRLGAGERLGAWGAHRRVGSHGFTSTRACFPNNEDRTGEANPLQCTCYAGGSRGQRSGGPRAGAGAGGPVRGPFGAQGNGVSSHPCGLAHTTLSS